MQSQAYRIVNWWKFEMLKNGKLATAKTKMAALRIKPLIYVRFPVHGHILTADYRRMVKRAGPDLAAACDGLYKMLVGLAGNQVREYRSWILDDRQQPLEPDDVAELLCLSKEKVTQIFEILMDGKVKWIEFVAFPESLHKSLNSNDLSGVSQIKKSGNNQEEKGSPLIETETEDVNLKDSIRSESNRRGGVWEKRGEMECEEEPQEAGENAGQAQARPPASVPASDTASITDSVSEKPTVSASDTAPVSDSDSKPAAGPGPAGPEPLSGQEKFDILFERNETEKKVKRILKINPRNQSDITTIRDIYEQFAHRLIEEGCPYPLFEYSLTTAKLCWRKGRKPIAMFVAAMEKEPFSYEPENKSVVPGKFSQGRNLGRDSSKT